MRPAEQWESHSKICQACRAVQLDKPATLGRACLEGAKLAKDAYSLARRELRREGRAA